MSTFTPILHEPEITYPESDGQPIAENTKQYEYIVTIKGGMDGVFRNDPNVFVAADLFWYPVEGKNKIRTAPDTMVVFGRPKGHRRSYLQWQEGNIAPQVVFEIISPGNRGKELKRKFKFFQKHGVEEYYAYDPDEETLEGWLRKDRKLAQISDMQGWVSPRLNVRFELHDGALVLFGPDGERFASYLELVERSELAEREKEMAEREMELAKREKELAEREKEQAERVRLKAQADLQKLKAQLKALGAEPEV
jgi:Uma2 family endonuclease